MRTASIALLATIAVTASTSAGIASTLMREKHSPGSTAYSSPHESTPAREGAPTFTTDPHTTTEAHPAVTQAGLAEPAAAPVCTDDLVTLLHEVGFSGKNLKEAWAIAMRESRGRERAVSHTGDYGLFQFNKAAHHTQPWWDSKELLTGRYNARVAYTLSEGGKTWYPWGLDGKGRTKAHIYQAIGWSSDKIHTHITQPYRTQYNNFPATCEHLTI